MNYKKTKYSKRGLFLPTFIAAIILVLIIIWCIKIFLDNPSLITAIPLMIIFMLTIYAIKGDIKGTLKGKIEVSKENKYIKRTNPYIYYRELPNNFGIGVNSLLLDSTLEDYKDIIAVILDLCAKKYLSLMKQSDKYVVKILKQVDSNLLSNEKYILNSIINNKINKINYRIWYDYCMQDGINLGLYYQKEVYIDKSNSSQNEIGKMDKKIWKKSIIIGVLFLIFSLFNGPLTFGNIWVKMSLSFMIVIVSFIILRAFTGLIWSSKKIGRQSQQMAYKSVRENNFIKTEKGIKELHKLLAFKSFLNNFGNFVDKKAKEVVLWDRYLSYAQVFGLTNEIMKSGYEQLVNNLSFQIDNINNINLYNIDLQ